MVALPRRCITETIVFILVVHDLHNCVSSEMQASITSSVCNLMVALPFRPEMSDNFVNGNADFDPACFNKVQILL